MEWRHREVPSHYTTPPIVTQLPGISADPNVVITLVPYWVCSTDVGAVTIAENIGVTTGIQGLKTYYNGTAQMKSLYMQRNR